MESPARGALAALTLMTNSNLVELREARLALHLCESGTGITQTMLGQGIENLVGRQNGRKPKK
jgi:hypothetical protein